jgi:membrane protease YdiL (CAAX protease family)
VPLAASCAGTALALAALDRASELSGPELAELLVVTAFGEELLFRGMFLPTAYRLTGRVRGEIVVACSFGLWHVPDAVGDAGDASIAVVVAVVLGQVVATTLAGFGFSWLRHRTGSLAGPVGAHVAINLPGLALRAS